MYGDALTLVGLYSFIVKSRTFAFMHWLKTYRLVRGSKITSILFIRLFRERPEIVARRVELRPTANVKVGHVVDIAEEPCGLLSIDVRELALVGGQSQSRTSLGSEPT